MEAFSEVSRRVGVQQREGMAAETTGVSLCSLWSSSLESQGWGLRVLTVNRCRERQTLQRSEIEKEEPEPKEKQNLGSQSILEAKGRKTFQKQQRGQTHQP